MGFEELLHLECILREWQGEKNKLCGTVTPQSLPDCLFFFFPLYNFAFLLQVHTEGLKGEQVREIQYLCFCCKDAFTYFNCLLD